MSLFDFGDKIGDWTQTTLVKFIRDLFQNQPPDFLPLLKAEEIQITKSLTLGSELKLSREPKFREIGATGQPTFQNSWVNFGGGWHLAGFWRDPFGMVHLRGLIKDGTLGGATPIFTLPPGFRPLLAETFSTPTAGSGGVARINVFADGVVAADVPSTNVWLSLSGISFRTT